jgi:glycosyltransferase involved in cell wall biosynthesis
VCVQLNDPVERKGLREPEVTIGVCVKNGAQVIGGAIESIISQDFPHEFMEVIFVDDGSVDSTLSVIKSYAPLMDMPVTVFHHDWEGLGHTRNVVSTNARGNYIIWVDCDMTFNKDFVRLQFEFMTQNPLVGIGKGSYGLSLQANLVSNLENMEFAISNVRNSEDKNSVLGAGGSIYRTKVLRQVGGFDECIRGSGEDMDVEQRIRATGWHLAITPAVFFENRRKTWNSLWREYCWHGEGGAYLIKERNQSFDVQTTFPLLVLKAEISRVIIAYKLTHRKIALLLPLHYLFKRTAWIYGFLRKYSKSSFNN